MRKPESGFTAAALAAVLFDELKLQPDVHLRVAYSGGLDSHVLLHALAALRTGQRFSLSAIHVDHDLQPASPDWSRHCAQVCTALGIPIEVKRVKVDGIAEEGVEAAARRARNIALTASLKPGDILLTAHHGDDQAETVLLQLLRGAGIPGLAAMPRQAVFGRGTMVRPLLGFSRAALHRYAREHQLVWIEDPTNQQSRWRRNFLRMEILPRLAGHWPAHAVMLGRTAQHAAEAKELLDELACADLATCTRTGDDARRTLSVRAVAAFSTVRQKNLLRYWLRQQGFLTPAAAQLDEVLAQVESTPRSQQSLVCWPGAEIWRYRDILAAIPACPPVDPTLDVLWDLDTPLTLPGLGRLQAVMARGEGLSRDRLSSHSLRVRTRTGGETLRLPGRAHHHALKKLLQAEGVPPWRRARLPLLYLGELLVAVADRWVCAPYSVGDEEEGLKIIWEPFVDAVSSPEKPAN